MHVNFNNFQKRVPGFRRWDPGRGTDAHVAYLVFKNAKKEEKIPSQPREVCCNGLEMFGDDWNN